MGVAGRQPPEQGQLVTVRQRHYVAVDIAKSTLPDRPLRTSGKATDGNDPTLFE